MRNIIRLLTAVGLAMVGTMLLAANTSAQTAKIAKIVGSAGATVLVNGQSQALAEGQEIPQNAVITTTNQEVYLEVATGVVASVKPNSRVEVTSLAPSNLELYLRQGSLVSQIDKGRMTGKNYGVRTARGVAAARGTAFSVSITENGFTVAATADKVTFTSAAGTFTIQAGMISITPPGATEPLPAVSLAQAVQSNPAVADVVRDAVHTVATVVQNNLGGISADSATNVIAQVVAVAVSVLPQEATTFTSEAVQAVTASGSATAGSADLAAGAVTAAAVQAAPNQAAQLAAAAAAAAPGQAGVITAAAQQVAPSLSDSIVQNVAASTGQSATAVQNSANAASGTAAQAVNTAKDATSNVVYPPPTPSPNTPVTQSRTTPQVPVVQPDGSNAGG